MGIDWYDAIARRNGGYKNDAVYTYEGISGEQIFEEELVGLLSQYYTVLDAGCGHGEFTLKMALHAKSLVGFDNSSELIRIAKALLEESSVSNIEFVYATTKQELPFKDEQFDLIYDRRGPTSIIQHPRILRSGGRIFGIHSGALDLVLDRLTENGFQNITIREFKDGLFHFPNEAEYTKFISGIPGHPNYALPEYQDELKQKIEENTVDGKIVVQDYRYIWTATKP
ncbi:SAM-dependent methyltransferase [Paenibacillus selenitireducens]|uniref:SAM-dependent methyltransferase n=1 Tax=Paenibacillus selenitireducens TaxID=1324314 RepID=A0A1T2X1J2_9BACL|nr:class I SAM-dependent methyltransferase [Paenibacillus selenitireducens]OPA73734.1 SAM-dependent methyltransferase [Paenibacillus selenitireducens]